MIELNNPGMKAEIIQKSVKTVKKVIKGAYQVVRRITYRDHYKRISGQDPLKCRRCGHDMELWKIWHPKYGVIFDECKNLKSGKYDSWRDEKKQKEAGEEASDVAIQLELI